MGFSLSPFSANRSFQFIWAKAIYYPAQNKWLQLGTPATLLPPSGTFYVPHELIPDSFQGPEANVAAWFLEDQPDWQNIHLGARFRASSLHQPPAEIITIALHSSNTDAIRKLLLDDGIAFPAGLTGRPILIEFEDSVVAGPFDLYVQDNESNRYVCDSTALLNPVQTWPSQGGGVLSRLLLSSNDQPRVFVSDDPLPQPSGNLFLASLEELLRRANLGGGVGWQRRIKPSEVTKHITAIRQVLDGLPSNQVNDAILQRLRPLTDRAELTQTAQTALDEFLTKHPIFVQTVREVANEQVAALREGIRTEVLGQEPQLQDAIAKLRKQHDDEKQRIADELRDEQQTAQSQLQETKRELAHLQKEKDKLSRSVDELDHRARPSCRWKTTGIQSTQVLASPKQTLEHLEKNLNRLGLLPSSAKGMAREAYVAACLGQMLMFRGSFALPLARVLAESFAGNCVHSLSVPVGLIVPIHPPPLNATDELSAVLIDGLNRSCFDSYSGDVAIMLEERCLGLRSRHDPVVIGTLLDAPSAVPPSPALLSCGPVFSTDQLSWKANLEGQLPEPGRCVASAWLVDSQAFNANNLIPENPTLSVRSRRNIAAAGKLLKAIASSTNDETEERVDASLLFGWVCPYLTNGELGQLEITKECRNRWEAAVQNDPQRLKRLLCLDDSKENA